MQLFFSFPLATGELNTILWPLLGEQVQLHDLTSNLTFSLLSSPPGSLHVGEWALLTPREQSSNETLKKYLLTLVADVVSRSARGVPGSILRPVLSCLPVTSLDGEAPQLLKGHQASGCRSDHCHTSSRKSGTYTPESIDKLSAFHCSRLFYYKTQAKNIYF